MPIYSQFVKYCVHVKSKVKSKKAIWCESFPNKKSVWKIDEPVDFPNLTFSKNWYISLQFFGKTSLRQFGHQKTISKQNTLF